MEKKPTQVFSQRCEVKFWRSLTGLFVVVPVVAAAVVVVELVA